MLSNERKNELGNKYLIGGIASKNDLETLNIQELIFLIDSAKHFKEKETFVMDDFEHKIAFYYEAVLDKVKNAEEIFLATNKATNYPHIDDKGNGWIFSKKEYAEEAKDYYMQHFIMLDIMKLNKDNLIAAFADLYRYGIENLLIDNGQYHLQIKRGEILPPPDWSNIPDIQIPIMNPKLSFAMLQFFQNLYTQNNYPEKQQNLHVLEDKMLDEVLVAKYLMPMKLQEKEPSEPDKDGMKILKEDSLIQVPNLVNQTDNTEWLPAFTDWEEFQKIYSKEEWSGNIATYDDLIALSNKAEGIVINAGGVSLKINEKNRQMIVEYRRSKDAPKEAKVIPKIIEKDTQVLIGEPKENPSEMVNAMILFMKTQKGIKKAFLRKMIKENEASYLVIVDFKGDKDIIFKGIADAALPHLNGMYLDLHVADEWALNICKDVKPFYKKGFLGLI
jgi:hypothetical protein